MKRITSVVFLLIIGLGSFAQSYILDTTFQPFFDIRNQPNVRVSDIFEYQNSGKILVAGIFKNYYMGAFFEGAVTYDSIGGLIAGFSLNSNGVGNIGYINQIHQKYFYTTNTGLGGIIDSNGQNTYPFPNWRLNTLSTVQCATGVPYFFDDGSALFVNGADNSQKPCKIINGTDTFPGRHIIKVSPQGVWDSSFVHDATFLLDGFYPYDSNRIIIYRDPNRFTFYDSTVVNGLCRIYLDGSLDTTFSSPLNPNYFGQTIIPTNVEQNGRFFLAGNFYLKGDTVKTPMARFNANGSLDSTFLYNQGPRDTAYNLGSVGAVAKTQDGGYLVGGFFNNYQGHVKKSIAKIDSIGLVEPQYFTSAGPDSAASFGGIISAVSTIVKSKFGGYYLAGNFLKWDNKASQPIIRITAMQTGVGLDDENLKAESINLFPNPTSGSITISSETDFTSITIYSILGEKLLEVDPDKRSWEMPKHKGIYFINLLDDQGNRITKKIVKH